MLLWGQALVCMTKAFWKLGYTRGVEVFLFSSLYFQKIFWIINVVNGHLLSYLAGFTFNHPVSPGLIMRGFLHAPQGKDLFIIFAATVLTWASLMMKYPISSTGARRTEKSPTCSFLITLSSLDVFSCFIWSCITGCTFMKLYVFILVFYKLPSLFIPQDDLKCIQWDLV